MVDSSLESGLVYAESRGGIALGIEVNQERASLGQGQTGRKVHCGCSLANPALLVDDR